MEYCIKEIRKLLRCFPDSDNKEKVERNLIEIAEDKYQELVESGMKVEDVRREVLESVCSIEDIRDALDVDNIEKEYKKVREDYNKQLYTNIILLILMPVLFFVIQFITNNETINNITFLIIVVAMMYFFYKVCTIIMKKGKSKKNIENYLEMRVRKIRNSIIGIDCFCIFICAFLDASGFFILLILTISFISYQILKYIMQKKISEKD